jgi:hypothetical protein
MIAVAAPLEPDAAAFAGAPSPPSGPPSAAPSGAPSPAAPASIRARRRSLNSWTREPTSALHSGESAEAVCSSGGSASACVSASLHSGVMCALTYSMREAWRRARCGAGGEGGGEGAKMGERG